MNIEDGETPLWFGNTYKQSGFSGTIYLGRNLTGNYDDKDNSSPLGEVKYLSFGNPVTRIPDYTFYQAGASDVKLPPSIKYIGKRCLQNINNTSIEFPASLDTIAAGAFANVKGLKTVKSMAIEQPVCDSTAFAGLVYAFARLEVPNPEAYRAAPGWRNFRNIVSTSGINGTTTDGDTPTVAVMNGTITVIGTDRAEIYAADGRLVFSGSPTAIPSLPAGVTTQVY